MKTPAAVVVTFVTFCGAALAQQGHANAGAAGGGRSGHGTAAGATSGSGGHAGISGAAAPRSAPGPQGAGWQGGGHRGYAGGSPQSTGWGMFLYPNTYTPNTYGSVSGFGNILYPGTGHAPGTYSPFSIVDPTFGTRLTNTVSGFGYPYGNGFGGYGYGYGRGYRRYGGGTTIVIPYAYPVYVPYPEPQAYEPPPAPQIIYVVPGDPDRSLTTTAPPQRGSVVTYVVPSRNEDTGASAAAPSRFCLIALKNHSIYSATEYWLEDDTLHYITTYGAHNQATLDQVDLEFTTRLNRERGVEFKLGK